MKKERETGLPLKITAFLLLTVFFVVPSAYLLAQSTTPDEPFGKGETSIVSLADTVFRFGVVLCVLAAAIYIAIGAFYYFAASGNASLAEEGKKIIQRSIIGLILALIAWIILNTIHPQFASEMKDPGSANNQASVPAIYAHQRSAKSFLR